MLLDATVFLVLSDLLPSSRSFLNHSTLNHRFQLSIAIVPQLHLYFTLPMSLLGIDFQPVAASSAQLQRQTRDASCYDATTYFSARLDKGFSRSWLQAQAQIKHFASPTVL